MDPGWGQGKQDRTPLRKDGPSCRLHTWRIPTTRPSNDISAPTTSLTYDVQLLEPPKPTLNEANIHLNNLLRYPSLTSTQRKQLLEINRTFMKEDAAKQKQAQLSQYIDRQAQEGSETTPP